MKLITLMFRKGGATWLGILFALMVWIFAESMSHYNMNTGRYECYKKPMYRWD